MLHDYSRLCIGTVYSAYVTIELRICTQCSLEEVEGVEHLFEVWEFGQRGREVLANCMQQLIDDFHA